MKVVINSIMILSLCLMSGCSMFNKKEIATEKHKEIKVTLEREIELLRLERRKILLQNSLDRLDAEVEKQLED